MRSFWAGLFSLFLAIAIQAKQAPPSGTSNSEDRAIYDSDRPQDANHPTPTASPNSAPVQPAQQDATTQNTAVKTNDAPKQYTVVAGTQILTRLQAPINTKTAQPGNGIYLQTIFPITVGNTVVIPVGSFVQGTIDRVVRPGRVKGRAQVQMHFTTLILPSGYTMSLPGALSDAPGAEGVHKKGEAGTLEHDPQTGRDIGATAGGAAIGTLATVGTLNAKAIGIGAGAGAAAGLLYTLFTRGDDIRIEAGTQMELVLQRPLVLEERRVEEANAHTTQLVPVETVHVLDKEKHTGIAPVPCGLPVCN